MIELVTARQEIERLLTMLDWMEDYDPTLIADAENKFGRRRRPGAEAMSDNLVGRLRAACDIDTTEAMYEAAREIERLTAENKRQKSLIAQYELLLMPDEPKP